MWTEKSSNASPVNAGVPLISVEQVALCYRYQKSIFARHKSKIWALHDVSFDLFEGEKLGIIGRNGSGKSTLMKILAKIFEPDKGTVAYARPLHVQLLSLGVGFEGALSGRENSVLNGMLLGKSRRHMLNRLEKIQDFSELGEFFDMPVSTYSTGMNARLGFAVAMETEPEVLLIDEVLGVGDARFAAKCQDALREKFDSHHTVVIISHDAATIQKICTRAVWIENGRTMMSGDVNMVAAAYLNAINSVEADPAQKDEMVKIVDNLPYSVGRKTGLAEIESVILQDCNGRAVSAVQGGEHVCLIIRARAHAPLSSPILGWFVKDRLGQCLFGENTFTYAQPPLQLTTGQSVEARFEFQLPMLPNGSYAMTVSIADGDMINHIQHHYLPDALLIQVSSAKLRYGLVGIPFQHVSLRPL